MSPSLAYRVSSVSQDYFKGFAAQGSFC